MNTVFRQSEYRHDDSTFFDDHDDPASCHEFGVCTLETILDSNLADQHVSDCKCMWEIISFAVKYMGHIPHWLV